MGTTVWNGIVTDGDFEIIAEVKFYTTPIKSWEGTGVVQNKKHIDMRTSKGTFKTNIGTIIITKQSTNGVYSFVKFQGSGIPEGALAEAIRR